MPRHFLLCCLAVGFVGLMSLITFCLMGVDKRRARKKRWRIPEKTLFLFAIFGGAIGGTLGMWGFHHKTKHWHFRFLFPLLALVQLAGLSWLAVSYYVSV